MSLSIIERPMFADRSTVGKALAEQLSAKQFAHPVVLALPRGGIPVAVEIARVLKAPLDLLLVKKIGVPGHEELALGAVIDGFEPQLDINEEIKRVFEVSDEQLESIKAREFAEIERRRTLYLHGRESVPLEGATAIIVDDGIATGATVRAALSGVRRHKPAALIVAIGVASPEVIGHLYPEVTDIVCLAQPDPFHNVGHYFEEYNQVTDEEVIDLIDSINSG